MALRVNHNLAALNARRAISRNVMSSNKEIERLSSGLRVNRSADDASGLVVSEGMRSQTARLGQNVRNAQHSADLLQVAEGSLQEVNNMLVRMKELSLQASTSTLNNTNRESVAAEFNQLISEIDRIAQATTYNNQALLAGFGNQVSAASSALVASGTNGITRVGLSAATAGTYTFVDPAGSTTLTLGNGLVTQTLNTGSLLDGSQVATGTAVIANFDRLGIQVTLAGANVPTAAGDYQNGELDGSSILIEGSTGGSFQVGPTDSYANRLEVGIADLRASGPTLNVASLAVNSISGAREAMTRLDAAVQSVAQVRGDLGAVQNRLSFAIGFTEVEIENTTASEATIRDADVALEISEFTRSQLLVQTSNAMLVQSNVSSAQVLGLL
ncbi:flagellin [Candidatus Latescibacterota bacterium]